MPTIWNIDNLDFLTETMKGLGNIDNLDLSSKAAESSLSSLLLKRLERLLAQHIKDLHIGGHFSKYQHAYTKSKSAETALHEVVGAIELLKNNSYTLSKFLNIEAAFK